MFWEDFVIVAVWLVISWYILKFILQLFGVSLGFTILIFQWIWKHKIFIGIVLGISLILMLIFSKL